MKITVKDIVYNGMIAALYVVLTLITYPLSFGDIQFRFAEILVLLCFFRKDYAIGLVLGCALANLFSSLGIIDVGFGTLATLIACLCIMFCHHLAIAIIPPVVANALIVALEINIVFHLPFWLTALTVAAGELSVLVVGYFIFFFLRKNKRFMTFLRANQNVDFKW